MVINLTLQEAKKDLKFPILNFDRIEEINQKGE